MANPYYRSFAEFEREIIRPSKRQGQTVEDILEDGSFEKKFDVDRDPWEEMLQNSEEE
jgi:hypothetical protein